VNPLEKFFANLRRLLEPRTGPTAESTPEPTVDRPPPFEPETLEPPTFQASAVLDDAPPADEPSAVAEALAVDITSPVDVTSPADEVSLAQVPPAANDARVPDDTSEVRDLLEAVAEASESAVQLPSSALESATQFPPPADEPAPASFHAPNEIVADVPTTAPARAGDALVLTLATPAATFTIAKSSATLGRGQENTVRLDDLSVSRRHARIAYRQGGYWLSDLGSMGGTWVDGVRLNAPRRIAVGEVIDIGLCRLTASFAGGAAKAEMKKSASTPRSEMAGQGRRRR